MGCPKLGLTACMVFLISSYCDAAPQADTISCGARSRILDPGDNSTILKPPHSHPWVVGISKFRGGKFSCGGTLISKRHVLTAAHCHGSYVTVGDHDQTVEDGEENVKVLKNTPHPNYKFNHAYDLRVLELENEVSNKYAKPVNLPLPNEHFKEYTVDGWGFENKNLQGSDILRTVDLCDIPEQSARADSCHKLSFDRNLNICGENPHNIYLGPCSNDSGGPWVSNTARGVTLAGVHIMGHCWDDDVPHVSMRLSNPELLTWVQDQMKY